MKQENKMSLKGWGRKGTLKLALLTKKVDSWKPQ